MFGAVVEQVRPVSIVNRAHFVNQARAAAQLHTQNVCDSKSSSPIH